MAASETPAEAGYSGTPLHRKLGIKPGHRVLAVGVPKGWDLGRLDPDGTAHVTTRATAPPYDVVIAFCPDLATLEATLAHRLSQVTQEGRLWVCWPKRASKVPTDLDDNVVRGFGLEHGRVDVKVCAIDATWSGQAFVVRLKDR
jgi:hypothetical protein